MEITLALLVIGLGLLAVFGLFPSGLAQAKRSADETQAAMFAEEVFTGFRGMAESDPALWRKLGPPDGDDPGLEGACAGMWINWGAGITVTVWRATPGRTPRTVRYVDWNGIVQYAFRYFLEFGSKAGMPQVKYGHLRVWTGEYGSTNVGDAVDFYTEFYNYGVRP